MLSRSRCMARQSRLRAVTAAQSRSYLAKAEEFLAGARSELDAGRAIAATSLAIHAGINAADAVTGARLGRRAAGQDHDQVLSLLRDAGTDGIALAKDLARLLPLKTKASTRQTTSPYPKPSEQSNVPRAAWLSPEPSSRDWRDSAPRGPAKGAPVRVRLAEARGPPPASPWASRVVSEDHPEGADRPRMSESRNHRPANDRRSMS